ncbi:MAG: thioredoxin [Dehalococcoidia bacterium]|nr:thioredoxin [Dehalococcoidia bacterium]
MIQSMTDEDHFRKTVLESKLPVLVDFWAEWCVPCLAAAPILEELAKEYTGKVNFAKVNVEDNSSIATKYGIAAIPTLLIFKDSQPVHQILGYKPKKEFNKVLDELLKD